MRMIWMLMAGALLMAGWVPAAAAQPKDDKGKGSVIFYESFDEYNAFSLLHGQNGWTGYDGTDNAIAYLEPVAGVGGSQALAIAAVSDSFDTRNIGLRRVADLFENGRYWIQVSFKPPQTWRGELQLKAGNTLVASSLETVWATWKHPWWRLHRPVDYEQSRWYTITMEVNVSENTYSAWIDDQVLAEDVVMLDEDNEDLVYLGGAGTETDPFFIDEVIVTRSKPQKFKTRDIFPEVENEPVFRFAAMGDPQLGMRGYAQNLAQLKLAADQVGRSEADLSVVLGDLVHDEDQVEAYADVRDVLDSLKTEDPSFAWYTVRGNHERRDLYAEYFNDELNYSVVHEGVRFVMLDAVGPGDIDPPTGVYEGLSEEQLEWVKDELQAAYLAREEVVMVMHVSPWQDNPRAEDNDYYQIGNGRDELLQLMNAYDVTMVLSGHYHYGVWHREMDGIHYLVVGGTALVREGSLSWLMVDVHPTYFQVYNKPIHFAYDAPDVSEFYEASSRYWVPFAEQLLETPDLMQGPVTIPRKRPSSQAGKQVASVVAEVPRAVQLRPNYPNPFNATTTIAFDLAEQEAVHLVVYDVLGRQVAELVNGPLPAGAHQVQWSAEAQPTGIYVAQLQVGSMTKRQTLVLMK